MNLEELISKYLDSELSYNEDEELRSTIAGDDLAREKFYASVSLHIAMREDAQSIETPRDLFDATENAVLMRIMNEIPLATDTVVRRRPVYAFATLACVLFLFSIFNISDLKILKFDPLFTGSGQTEINQDIQNNNAQGNIIQRDNMASSKIQNYGENISNKRPAITSRIDRNSNNDVVVSGETNSKPLTETEITTDSKSTASNLATDNNKILNEQQSDKQNSSGDLFTSKNENDASKEGNINSNRTIQNQSNILSKTAPIKPPKIGNTTPGMKPISGFEQFGGDNDVTISTFFGTDVLRGGLKTNKNSAISHFSQGIGYAINEKSKVGIEIGYTEYSYNENVIMKLPLHSIEYNGNNVEVVNPTGSDGNDVSVHFPSERIKQLYWGAAFYEAQVIDGSGFSILGRLGLGGSNDGPLGFIRLYGKYEIFSGFYLTFGADGRLFDASMYNLYQPDKELKRTASFIYGLQVKF